MSENDKTEPVETNNVEDPVVESVLKKLEPRKCTPQQLEHLAKVRVLAHAKRSENAKERRENKENLKKQKEKEALEKMLEEKVSKVLEKVQVKKGSNPKTPTFVKKKPKKVRMESPPPPPSDSDDTNDDILYESSSESEEEPPPPKKKKSKKQPPQAPPATGIPSLYGYRNINPQIWSSICDRD